MLGNSVFENSINKITVYSDAINFVPTLSVSKYLDQ